MSLAQDMVYAASRDSVVPPKHIALPMAVRHLTRSEQLVITLLNRYGHGISQSGLARVETGIAASVDYPVPSDVSQIRSFVSLAGYYRRFIAGFSQLAAPLFALLEKGSQFVWSDACQSAFVELKYRLTTSPVLSFPQFDIPFQLAADASNTGLGAVLSQTVDGREVVIAYASWSLHKPEKNYSVTEREALALVWATKVFRPYLYGRSFELVTDHCPLTWLCTIKEPKGRTARWIMLLEEFHWSIVHRAGKEHGNADALSRRPHDKREQESVHTLADDSLAKELAVGFEAAPEWSKEQLQQRQAADPTIAQVLECVTGARPAFRGNWKKDPKLRQFWRVWHQLSVDDGVLTRTVIDSPAAGGQRRSLTVVPQSLLSDVLEKLHDATGHMGMEKTIDLVRGRVWRPGYTSDIEDWLKKCSVCARKKNPAPLPKVRIQSIPVGRPAEMWAMDFVGPLPLSDGGNRHILVMCDYFTRWVEAIPLPDQRAETVARVVLRDIVSRYGVPVVLHSDRGANFESRVIRELTTLVGIKKVRTTAYHPQCDGLVERLNRTILTMLSKHVADNQRDWDIWLPCVLLAYRSAKQCSTGLSPFRLKFGREARLPADVTLGMPDKEPVRLATEYVTEVEKKQQQAKEIVDIQLAASQQRQARNDGSTVTIQYEPGDLVWLHQTALKAGLSPKLSSPWSGPYRVMTCYDNSTFRIKPVSGGRVQRVHHDRIKPCYVCPLAEVTERPV